MGRRIWQDEERMRMVGQVVRLRKKGKKFAEIGKALGIEGSTARYLLRMKLRVVIRLADVPRGARMPMRTLAGMMWQWPPVRPRCSSGVDGEMGVCGKCRLLDECRRRVVLGPWGRWFTGCERPLEREMGVNG
jgi:hypothetical protein